MEASTAERFTPELRASENAHRREGINQPTYTKLVEHMDRFGPEGVLESAVHLPEAQYDKLAERAKRMRYDRRQHKWTS